MILRAIQERAGFLGKIVAGLAGVAWSLATFFMVPVLVLEQHSIRESFTRSVSTFKQTWGESMGGNISIAAAALVAWVTLIAVAGLIAWVGAGWLALAALFIGGALLIVLTSARKASTLRRCTGTPRRASCPPASIETPSPAPS